MEISLHQPADLPELKRRIRHEKNAKQRDRFRAVLLALQGLGKTEIRQRLARSKSFVEDWVYTYRDHGLEAIAPKKQTGQPTKLPRDREAEFIERIESADQPLRGKEIREILEEEFGASYSLQGAYDLLHRLGFEPLQPRPSNPKKDPAAEAAWRRNAPLL